MNGLLENLSMEEKALWQVGKLLREEGYEFITPTPETHRRVSARAETKARDLRDVFGWSRPFQKNLLPRDFFELLTQAKTLETVGDLYHCSIRFSTLGKNLFLHSAYPTLKPDSVFFGPDTYRFASLIERGLKEHHLPPNPHIIDVGCGSGAGGIVASQSLTQPSFVISLSDINPLALKFSRINCLLAEIKNVNFVLGDGLEQLKVGADLILSNPPYLVDREKRTYRHGGGTLGLDLSLKIIEDSLPLLKVGGLFILYTGTPIIAGQDPLLERVKALLTGRNIHYTYKEIDPDVFGEELQRAPYLSADRIAVVSLLIEV